MPQHFLPPVLRIASAPVLPFGNFSALPLLSAKEIKGFYIKFTKKNKLKLISMKIKLILSGQTELSPPSRGYSKKKASSSYMALIYRRGL